MISYHTVTLKNTPYHESRGSSRRSSDVTRDALSIRTSLKRRATVGASRVCLFLHPTKKHLCFDVITGNTFSISRRSVVHVNILTTCPAHEAASQNSRDAPRLLSAVVILRAHQASNCSN